MLRLPQTRTARVQLALVVVFLAAFAIGVKAVADYVDRMALQVDLRDAISRGDLDAIEEFERQGIDWSDLEDLQNHYSPLFEAIKRGHLHLVRYFVENGADILASTPDGYNAPRVAALHHHVAILKYLLMDTPNGERIAREDQSIHPIGPYADLELVAWLSPRVDLADSIWGEDALRLLCLAVQEEDEDMFEFLLKIGAPKAMVSEQWDEGFYRKQQTSIEVPPRWIALYEDFIVPRPLHHAARLGNEKFAKRLIEFGANPRAKDKRGKTPIDYAKIAGHEHIVALLQKPNNEN